jgi:DME family drug/metabolite transporter
LGGLRKQIEISKTPVIASVEIVVATLIGIIVFEEGLNFINMLGIIIIFSSIVIINMKTPYEGARHQ